MRRSASSSRARFIVLVESLELRKLLSASSLDSTLDGDGILTAGTAGTDEVATDMLIQPDGNILVCGTAGSGTTSGVLMRFLPSGAPDTLFGGGDGRVDDFLSGNVEFDAVARDGSGNLYVAGTDFAGLDTNFIVARFTSAGVLDLSFAGVGWISIDLGGSDFGRDIALTGGGIVVAGYSGDDFAAIKLTIAGMPILDPGFGTAGMSLQDLNSGSIDKCEAMAVQSDGSLVLVGGSDNDFAVLKLSSSGALTASTTTDSGAGAADTLSGVTIGSGDSIIAAGTFVDTTDHFIVAKYDSSASIVNAFDGDGIAEISGAIAASDVTLDSSGNIVAVGIAAPGSAVEFAVARLDLVTGAADGSFAPGGLVTTPIGTTFDAAGAVAAYSGGRLVVAGFTFNGTDMDFAVARYGDAPSNVVTAALDLDGNLVITGTGNADSIVITRNTAGINVATGGTTISTGFNPTGRVVITLGDSNDQVNVASSVTTPLYIDAGAGDDTVKGGNGPDILLGGPGFDRLMGSGGRDLLIGGTGTDRMLGDNEDDILIASSTAHDSDPTALFAIHTEWTSGSIYATRVYNIRNGGGANGSYKFDAAAVVDDGVIDTLSGNAGTDWFLFNEGHDVITDLHRNEFGEDIA